MTAAIIKIAFAVAIATQATAGQPLDRDPRIDSMCGAGHENELVSTDDFAPNPAGFYIKSLNTQLEPGDPSIVLTAMDEPWLCTRPAGNPSMSHAEAMAVSDQKVLKFLFVPAGAVYPATYGR